MACDISSLPCASVCARVCVYGDEAYISALVSGLAQYTHGVTGRCASV
jgi:hypothetical protein